MPRKLADKKRRAAGSVANYGLHSSVSDDYLDVVAALDPRDVAGVQVFMGFSTDKVGDPRVLHKLFACMPTILLAHCEHTPSILADEARYREQNGDAIPAQMHPKIRDAEANLKSSSLAIELARRFDTRRLRTVCERQWRNG